MEKSIEGMNIVVAIPKEYTRLALLAGEDATVMLDMPMNYAKGLCNMLLDGLEMQEREMQGKVVDLP